MTKLPRKSFALAAFLGMLILGLAPTANAQDVCYTSLETQNAIDAGLIKSQYQVLEEAGIDSLEMLNYQVCEEGGELVYIIGILRADGQAENLILSAQ